VERTPERVGPYELHEELGRGGMGAVFRAVDTRSGAEVALKLLGAANEQARRRLLVEAQALARLRHRNVVSLLEAGEHRGRPWLALELVRGRSLEARLAREGPLPAREAALLVRSLAVGLAHAHREGVVHRDLKPANVLLPADGGEPKLGDFGLAGFTEAEPGHSRLTKTGAFMGTPGYWAPEQAAGDRAALGPATDVYGLGALLHAALTGRPPVEAETLAEILAATERQRPVATGADPALDRLALHCLEKRPGDRPPSVDAVARELSRWLASGGVRSGPDRRPVLAVLALLLAGACGAAWWRSTAPGPAVSTQPSAAGVPSAASAGPAPPGSADEADGVGSPELEALLDVARAHANRREFAEGLAVFDRAAALEPRSARACTGRGACRAALGDHAAAILDYDLALARQPRSAYAVARRALSRDALGDRDGALRDYARAIDELGLRDPAIVANRGMTRADLGDHAGAITDYDQALEESPMSVNMLVARARSHAALDHGEAARRDYDRALELDPRSGEALTNRGVERARRGDHAGAIADYDRALEVDPGSLVARVNRGVARGVLGDHAAAIADFDLALAAGPRDVPALVGRGEALRGLLRLEEALADFERALELDPGNLAALAGRGGTRSSLGRFEAALEDLDRVLARAPGDVPALVERVAARSGRGDWAGALADLDLALEARPGDTILLMNRGFVRSSLGDPAAAIADYEAALRSAPPGSPHAATLRDRLEAERAKLTGR
jgi:tetratricopeptide (TPR) repeat protein